MGKKLLKSQSFPHVYIVTAKIQYRKVFITGLYTQWGIFATEVLSHNCQYIVIPGIVIAMQGCISDAK